MKIQLFAAIGLAGLAGCVDDYRHISLLQTSLNVDGRAYLVERHIGTETILNTASDPQYFARVGAARYACNSTSYAGCATVIRRVEAQNRAAAAAQ